MPICTVCPGCAAIADLPEELRGQQIRCTNCRTVFVVGQATPWTPPVAEPSTPEPVEPQVQTWYTPPADGDGPVGQEQEAVWHEPQRVDEDLSPAPTNRAIPEDEYLENDPWPRRRRRRRARRTETPVGLILGGVLGVLLIVAGIVMLVIGLAAGHSG